MTRLLIVGATGLVGRHALAQALRDDRISQVTAPTRRPLPPHPKLLAPLVDFSALPADADWWPADAAICTLGTTRSEAGSREAFRAVDYAYPLAVASQALRHGATRFALTSAMGADPHSRIFYLRTKGELERSLTSLGFASLTLVRPGLLGGSRPHPRLGEQLASALLRPLGPLLPARYRISPAEVVAHTLLEAALAGQPGLHIIEADRLTSRDR